mgnify:CR=1 FL=1
MSPVDSSLPLRLLAALALMGGAMGCATGGGPDEPLDPNCLGSKCDDPVGPPTPHALAVADCDEGHAQALADAEDSTAKALSAWNEYNACLRSADNSVIANIEANLATNGTPSRDRDSIIEVYEEFRYASLCSDIEAVAGVLGDELALIGARCTSNRERSLAHVVSALVDYTGERSPVFLTDEREQFSDCYESYDESMPDGDEATLAAREALVSCAGDALRGEALVLKEAYCELLGCPDDLLITSFIQAGFDTAIDTSENACDMLVDASIYTGAGGMQQELNCRLSIYAQLRVATLDGLTE